MFADKTKAEVIRQQYPIQTLLNRYGVERTGATYKCPFHAGGENKGYSAYVGTRGSVVNKLSCSHCYSKYGAQPYSVIDIYMHFENCSAGEAINALYEDLAKGNVEIHEYKENAAKVKIEAYEDALEAFTEYNNLEPRYKRRIDKFFEERKLYHAKEILAANGYRVGIKTFTSSKGQTYNNMAFDFKTFIQSRAGGSSKYNTGSTEPKILKVNSDRTYMIVEGFTDALAAAELGYNSICLHGVNNFSKLKLRKSFKYILALDNDTAGDNVANKLLSDQGLAVEVFNELKVSGYKDLGEYYKNLKG